MFATVRRDRPPFWRADVWLREEGSYETLILEKPTRVSHKSIPAHKTVPQESPTRVFHEIVPENFSQEWVSRVPLWHFLGMCSDICDRIMYSMRSDLCSQSSLRLSWHIFVWSLIVPYMSWHYGILSFIFSISHSVWHFSVILFGVLSGINATKLDKTYIWHSCSGPCVLRPSRWETYVIERVKWWHLCSWGLWKGIFLFTSTLLGLVGSFSPNYISIWSSGGSSWSCSILSCFVVYMVHSSLPDIRSLWNLDLFLLGLHAGTLKIAISLFSIFVLQEKKEHKDREKERAERPVCSWDGLLLSMLSLRNSEILSALQLFFMLINMEKLSSKP